MLRVGIGFDAHRFGKNRKLFLGGIEIPSEKGLSGHSDADVLLHALGDAMLGAAGLGDLGTHFPDSDRAWKGAASSIFIKRILEMLRKKKCRLLNIDLTVLAQSPKLAPHRARIRGSIAQLVNLPAEAINLKATTTDAMGFIGRKEGIAAQAIVLIEKTKETRRPRRKTS